MTVSNPYGARPGGGLGEPAPREHVIGLGDEAAVGEGVADTHHHVAPTAQLLREQALAVAALAAVRVRVRVVDLEALWRHAADIDV